MSTDNTNVISKIQKICEDAARQGVVITGIAIPDVFYHAIFDNYTKTSIMFCSADMPFPYCHVGNKLSRISVRPVSDDDRECLIDNMM